MGGTPWDSCDRVARRFEAAVDARSQTCMLYLEYGDAYRLASPNQAVSDQGGATARAGPPHPGRAVWRPAPGTRPRAGPGVAVAVGHGQDPAGVHTASRIAPPAAVGPSSMAKTAWSPAYATGATW